MTDFGLSLDALGFGSAVAGGPARTCRQWTQATKRRAETRRV